MSNASILVNTIMALNIISIDIAVHLWNINETIRFKLINMNVDHYS